MKMIRYSWKIYLVKIMVIKYMIHLPSLYTYMILKDSIGKTAVRIILWCPTTKMLIKECFFIQPLEQEGRCQKCCIYLCSTVFIKHFYQGSQRSGKSQWKVKILKSQEKVSKFWYVAGNFDIHQKVRKKSGKIELISIWSPHFKFWLSMSWCHAQSHSCQQEMQSNWETYFHNIWHFVNYVTIWLVQHIEWQAILIFLPNGRCNFFFFLHLCDPGEFRRRSKYHIFMLQKVSKNWDFVREKVRKRSGNFIAGDQWEPCLSNESKSRVLKYFNILN